VTRRKREFTPTSVGAVQCGAPACRRRGDRRISPSPAAGSYAGRRRSACRFRRPCFSALVDSRAQSRQPAAPPFRRPIGHQQSALAIKVASVLPGGLKRNGERRLVRTPRPPSNVPPEYTQSTRSPAAGPLRCDFTAKSIIQVSRLRQFPQYARRPVAGAARDDEIARRRRRDSVRVFGRATPSRQKKKRKRKSVPSGSDVRPNPPHRPGRTYSRCRRSAELALA